MKKISLLVFFLLLFRIGMSQCDDDRHSTNWYDGWVACASGPSPNIIRGNSYWVHYDLGQTYQLGQTHFWNYNDPSHKNYGLKTFVIDYSTDGVNWTEAENVFLLQGSGSSYYEGLDGPNLNGINARYVLITAIENWGGACYALGEVKIEVESSSPTIPVLALDCLELEIYPNPAIIYSTISISTNCLDDVTYTLYNAFGQVVDFENLGSITYYKFSLPIGDLSPGVYYIVVEQNNQSEKIKLVVL